MRSLLLIAHGSRRAAANEEIRRLAAQLAERMGPRYGHVGCGFLELAEPDIPAAIDAAVDRGATEIVVLPYFLATGRHVAEDIPAAVAERQARHPTVRLRIAAYPGAAPEMLDLLAALVEAASD
ncbi:MAG: CbiX/SirB N-terminal domain-containing protein [Candidatus Competibacterales bacterium]|nr:CbiX/SirB N-terminal domain-containing protein [Candidatus Competibacterales bacterium]